MERGEGWPAALEARDAGLALDGCDLDALATEHGTPLWAISRSTLERNFLELRDAFAARYAPVEVAYSVKAHNTGAAIRILHLVGAKMDCSAEHEFRLALRAGVPAADVILNGNGKSSAALEAAAELGVGQVNVDSVDEVRRLEAIAARLGRRVRCCVRVQLTYAGLLQRDPSFATTLRVGEGKFGSNVASGEAFRTIDAVVAAPHLDLAGLSHHVGFSGYMGAYTAEAEVMHHRECTRELCTLANDVTRRTGVVVDRLDLGGGFRVGGRRILLSTPGAGADVAFHDLPTAGDYADAIFGELERTLASDTPPTVQFESGGGIVADAVALLARVSEVKDVVAPARRRYVTVDASMMMFVSRGMMRVGHPVVVASRPFAAPDDVPVEVVGQTCVYDSVAEDILLPPVAADDLLAILGQGAYCETQSTQFNAFPRPAVVLVDGGRSTVVKRRETLDDLVARDRIPPALGAPA